MKCLMFQSAQPTGLSKTHTQGMLTVLEVEKWSLKRRDKITQTVCSLEMVLNYWKTAGCRKCCKTGRVVITSLFRQVALFQQCFSISIWLCLHHPLLTVGTLEWWWNYLVHVSSFATVNRAVRAPVQGWDNFRTESVWAVCALVSMQRRFSRGQGWFELSGISVGMCKFWHIYAMVSEQPVCECFIFQLRFHLVCL